MNTLKKYMLILSAALCCASCSDEDEDAITWAKDAISLSTETIQIAKDGGTTEAITVKSSGDWRLSGACEWAHPSATSGSDGDAVTFVIDKNETDSDRKATFKFFTGGAVAALQIEVLRDYVMVLESEENMIVGEEQTSIAVKLSGSIVEPDVQLTEAAKDWLKLDRISTFNGITIISFAVSANESYKDRSSVINISSPLVDTPIQVNLTQSRTLAIIPDEETIMKDLSASKITFSLRYNVEYELVLSAGSDAWVTNQTISKPVVGEDGLTTVTISYDLLEGTNARAAELTIIGKDTDISSKISIIQKDPAAEFATIPDASLFKIVKNLGWIMPITETQCIVLDEGINATTFSYNTWDDLYDLTGIENFPNLERLVIKSMTQMRKFDISGLHKVSSISMDYNSLCEIYNLGDNPILSFDAGGKTNYSNIGSLSIISSKVETIDLGTYYTSWDNVTTIDVSECPALTTLNANRSDKVTTLILKQGQVIPNLTKNDNTEIVYK